MVSNKSLDLSLHLFCSVSEVKESPFNICLLVVKDFTEAYKFTTLFLFGPTTLPFIEVRSKLTHQSLPESLTPSVGTSLTLCQRLSTCR